MSNQNELQQINALDRIQKKETAEKKRDGFKNDAKKLEFWMTAATAQLKGL